MKIILSHPTGNANVRGVATSMASAGSLLGFYTCIATFPNKFLDNFPRNKFSEELKRRRYDTPIGHSTHLYPWKELGRLLALKIGWNNFLTPEVGKFCIEKVYSSLDKKVASSLTKEVKKGAEAIYAYEDGALESFKKAKKLGLKCIYDLPIAYWETSRNLLMEEAERLPQWKETLGGGIFDSEAKLIRKEQELELADVVVGPGSFVMDSLPEWAKNKKQITAPFGSPETFLKLNKLEDEFDTKRPLKILFLGSMGQRKGLGDLFAAMQLLKGENVQLIVLGSLLAPMEFYKKQLPDFKYEPGRPHHEVLKLMRTCDIFCLPSIVEGRALVMQEAMSQGLPIIITPNTGGEDLIKEGETGFLVPIRSPEAIAEKIIWFLNNREKIPAMGKMAQDVASSYTWEKYGTNILREITAYLSTN